MKNFKVLFKIRDGVCTFSCKWMNEKIRDTGQLDYLIKVGDEKRTVIIGSCSFPELKIDSEGQIHFFLRGRNHSRDDFTTKIREDDFNKFFGFMLVAMNTFDKSIKNSPEEDVASIIDFYGEIIEINETTVPILMRLFGAKQ